MTSEGSVGWLFYSDMASLTDFLENPSERVLRAFNKKQLVDLVG